MLLWIGSILNVVPILSDDDGLTIRCYECSGYDKPDCEKTCEASIEGACTVFIENGYVVQGCYMTSFGLANNIGICKSLNFGLLSLLKLTPSTKNLCYTCHEDMCNEFAKMPRDNLSAYDQLLPEMEGDDQRLECYKCNSRNFKDCNKKTEFCYGKTMTCYYSLYQDGSYQQGCRTIDSLDDFECEKIQNSTNTTKEFCFTCDARKFEQCNTIKREVTVTEPKKNDTEEIEDDKSLLGEGRKTKEVTQNESSTTNSSVARISVPTFLFYVIWSSAYLILLW